MPELGSPLRVPREVLAKLVAHGPRYTSYPTAPEWRDEVPEAEAKAWLTQAMAERAEVPWSLYLHVPFCWKLCYFCGCTMMVTERQALVERYLAALEREVELLAALGVGKRPVVAMHWGGGTPTYLKPGQIRRVMAALRKAFTFAEGAELGLELHPGVTTHEHLEVLAEEGFTRVSMGVQDFDPEVQKAVNRIQPHEVTKQVIEWSRSLGFTSVNVDLMYGLPYQSVASFEPTLEKVRALRPDRLALFHYAHVPWLRKHQTLLPESEMPNGEVKLDMFESAVAGFMAEGYEFIGMDHFALPTDGLAIARREGTMQRNFMGYTTGADTDLLSLGPSSISDHHGWYLQNRREVVPYCEALEAGQLPLVRGMALSKDDLLRRDVINGLFCQLRVDKRAIEAKHGVAFDEAFAAELEALKPLAEEGLVDLTPEALELSSIGQVLVRNVAMVFDAYLKAKAPEAGRFSRTV